MVNANNANTNEIVFDSVYFESIIDKHIKSTNFFVIPNELQNISYII